MKRSTLMILGGTIFILAGIAVVIIAILIDEEIIPMLSVASAVIFTGIIILFSGIDEKRIGKEEIVKPQKAFGKIIVEASFGKRYALPIFLILFGTVVLAIVSGILYLSGNEEAGSVFFGISSVYGLVLNIYFIYRLSRTKDKEKTDKQMDELAWKVAFFFATLATGGLFAIGYLIYKKLKK